jgi:hypothetical protein
MGRWSQTAFAIVVGVGGTLAASLPSSYTPWIILTFLTLILGSVALVIYSVRRDRRRPKN